MARRTRSPPLEDEDRQGHERRRGEWQHHRAPDGEVACSVDEGCLLQLGWQGQDRLPHEEQPEGRDHRTEATAVHGLSSGRAGPAPDDGGGRIEPRNLGYRTPVDPAPTVEATPHVFGDDVPGLRTGVLLHRSRHADTVRGTWLGREVVAKRIREDIVDAGERQGAGRGILREGLLLDRVEHRSIVRVVQLVHDPATLVLELVPGRPLREELRLRRRLPAEEAARVGAQLAAALDHLHRRWILHRDVKPANIIYDGVRAVLIDFHLAKEPGPMRGGAGTRLFTAPEQVRGGTVTSAADVWGLGTVLYRCVSGRLPFHAATGHPQLTERPVPVLERLATSRFDGDLRRAEAELPRALAALVDRMLAAHPGRRPTAAEVVHSLRQLAGGDAAA